MNCGDELTPECIAVLAELSTFIDQEDCSFDSVAISAHLADCPGCLHESQIELLLKLAISKACACAPTPEVVRLGVIEVITQIRSQELGRD